MTQKQQEGAAPMTWAEAERADREAADVRREARDAERDQGAQGDLEDVFTRLNQRGQQ